VAITKEGLRLRHAKDKGLLPFKNLARLNIVVELAAALNGPLGLHVVLGAGEEEVKAFLA